MKRVSLRRVVAAAFAAAAVLSVSARVDAAGDGGRKLDNGGFDDRPIVVLREDDIRASWRVPYPTFGGLSALEYGKLKRIPICWGIITSAAESGWGLTWAQIKDYLDTVGGEAISHSSTHSPMPDTQGYIDELVNSKALIEQKLPGYTCTSFYQPGTWTGEAYLDSFSKLDGQIGQAILANYERSMAYLGGGWCVGPVQYAYGMSYSFGLDYGDPSVEQVLAALDVVAATPGLVFVVSCHGVVESGGGPSDVKAPVMKAFMDRAAELRDSGQLRLMSLRDAYSAQFSPHLNRLADPGFELCSPAVLKDYGPWRLYGGARVSEAGARDGARCAVVPPNGQAIQYCIVQPGRYRLKWWQKTQTGTPHGQGVYVYLKNYSPTAYDYQVQGLLSLNSALDTWEERNALVLVRERLPTVSVAFNAYGGATVGIDAVSLLPEPSDPLVSCAQSAVVVHPGTATLSWNTPPGDVETVQIRCGARGYPITTQEGALLAQMPAVPGTRQEVTVQFNWTQQTPGAFFSVFAIDGDGNGAPPDLAPVGIDRSAPATPGVQVKVQPGAGVSGAWISNDPDSAIEQYRYAVGDFAGDNSVLDWTYTNETSASLSGVPTARQLYLSVQAQNVFGYWSPVGSTVFELTSSIPQIVGLSDGITVGVSGVVTAVFDDCCYIQQPGAPRGIKVRNAPPCAEGDTLSVNGILGTERGERVLVAR